MEFSNKCLSMEYSVFNDVFCQLHQSNLFLQELTQNLVKEQVRMAEMMTRVQVDLKVLKESQNDRLEDMMHNIDSDIKKVQYDVMYYDVMYCDVLLFMCREAWDISRP